MSAKSSQSLSSLRDIDKMDTIPCRIEFIKNLLSGKELEPMVNFDNTDTEYFLPICEDEDSTKSKDTIAILKKRFFDFTKIINQIGGRLEYIKSGTTGHTFKGRAMDEFGEFNYGIKVAAYPKKEKYGPITDIKRPENAELAMIKLLSYFVVKKQTPHITLPIGTFYTSISNFVNLIEGNIVGKTNEKYLDFLKRYRNGDYHEDVSILISEWANKGDLIDFIRVNYKAFTPLHWKVIFFQILSVLAVIQSKYPAFRHNDLKANNILVHKIFKKTETFNYRILRKVYKVPNIGYQIKLWDFDFSCIPDIVDNSKVNSDWTKKINVRSVQNKYYDMHYFFNTLRDYCRKIFASEYFPDEAKKFIYRILPKKYRDYGTEFVHEKGRILVDDEYTNPAIVISTDPYFAEFRPAAKPDEKVEKVVLIDKIDRKQTISQKIANPQKNTTSKTTSPMQHIEQYLKKQAKVETDSSSIDYVKKGGSKSKKSANVVKKLNKKKPKIEKLINSMESTNSSDSTESIDFSKIPAKKNAKSLGKKSPKKSRQILRKIDKVINNVKLIQNTKRRTISEE